MSSGNRERNVKNAFLSSTHSEIDIAIAMSAEGSRACQPADEPSLSCWKRGRTPSPAAISCAASKVEASVSTPIADWAPSRSAKQQKSPTLQPRSRTFLPSNDTASRIQVQRRNQGRQPGKCTPPTVREEYASHFPAVVFQRRSEERRVGRECRSRG